ncbi:MAG: hypothetical protein HC845_09555 [Akkermansiaceae bacterium]|nr:hypothetical protein [Akkermansiaceae bacterium]
MKLLPIACLVFSFAASFAKESQASKLLDQIISQPGSYSQVCDVMMMPQDVPYRAFQISDFAGASFSEKNQNLLRKNRDILVKSIRERLLEIDFSREAKQPAEDLSVKGEEGDGDPYGADPQSLNPLLLDIILQLNATEALPELLAIEGKIVAAIAKAKDDASAKPPVTYGWFVNPEGSEYDENEPEAKRERRLGLFQARVAQRDLVMTIAKLMRKEKYEPYLKTKLEAAYVKGLKEDAKEFKFPQFSQSDVVPNEIEGEEIERDEISGVTNRKYTTVSIPYTRESRDEIRAAAQKWIAAHP